MASAAPTFPSTRETTNYARLCRLLVDVGSQVLRETFDSIHPAASLHSVLGKPPVNTILKSLQNRKILNPGQWDTLYPAISSQVSSKNFDITLLMVLLRNVCGLTPPGTGWDALPLPADLSREADIARVKYYRNTVCGHVAQASVDDLTFNNCWKEIRRSLVRLGGRKYQEPIDKLETDPLDPAAVESCKKLDESCKKLDELTASIIRLAPTTDDTTISTLRSELPEEESNIHGRTVEVDEIVQALSFRETTKAGILVSGTLGVGKSTVAIKAGHRLKKEFGKTVKFCPLREAGNDASEVREILNVCAEGHQQTNENPRYVLRGWCRRLKDDVILILDNADDALERSDSFMSLLQHMRTWSDRQVKFLITSRLSDVGATTGLDFQRVKIGPLGLKETIEVLMNGAGLTNDKPETQGKLNKIAELCENNPLALRLAGPLLAEDSEYTFEELIKELQDNATKPLRLDRVMAVAFERLDDPSKDALVGLSVFARSFGRDAAKALLGINCADHLTKLKQRCLIQRQGKRYLIHLLIRAYARQMGKGQKLRAIVTHCQQRFLEYFLSLIVRYAKEYWGKGTCKDSLRLFNEERLNLESTLIEVGQNKNLRDFKELVDVVDACGLIAPYIEDCVPSKLYVCFLNGLLRVSESQKKITKQVEILWLLYDESRRHGGDRENSEGLIKQAKTLHYDNLPSFEQNSLSEICYLSHYGRYLSQDLKKRDEAQPLLRRAVSMFEEGNIEHCASTFDMGRVLSQIGHNERMDKEEGEIRHEEALTCYQKALSFRQSHYGEHVVTALAHKDLADYYLFIEDFSKAEENYEAAERIFEDLGMTKQKEAVPTYKNFGRCYEKSGKIVEALLKFEMGCDVAEATIEGSDKWKVEINTYLAMLLYKHYPDEVSRAVKITQDVFHMAQERNLKTWQDKEELEELYNIYRNLVNTD